MAFCVADLCFVLCLDVCSVMHVKAVGRGALCIAGVRDVVWGVLLGKCALFRLFFVAYRVSMLVFFDRFASGFGYLRV